jgi:hypothetical protein
LLEALHVLSKLDYIELLLASAPVGSNTLEHVGTTGHALGRDVNLGVVPVHKLAV